MNQADIQHSSDFGVGCGKPISTFLFKFSGQQGSVEIFKKQGGRAPTGPGYRSTVNQQSRMRFVVSAERYSTRDRCRGRTWGWRPWKTLETCRFSLFHTSEIRERLECVTGYHIKQTYPPRQTTYSQVARPAPVGSLEPVGANLGPHTHYEADSRMGLGSGHHPVDLSSPLQRPFESKV